MNGLRMTEGTLFSIPQVPDTNWRIRSVGDLNGDGRSDLFWQHQGDGRISVWLMDGVRVISGVLLSPSQVADTNWKIVGTADFDGNGSRDLVWHHQGDGRIAVWFMNGTTLIDGSLTSPSQVPETNWKIRAVGDLNADGKPDLIWQHIVDGRISVWLMNGLTLVDGMLLSPSQVSDTNWHIVGPR
jgi:FG-GAP-like repeat